MEVVNDYPPMFDEIDARFHVRGKPVIFTWGDQIFNPQGVPVSAALQSHESVHSRQQGADPSIWWRSYLKDGHFRFQQELEAHRAEYRWFVEHAARNARRVALKQISRRLASPLYGNMVSPKHARSELLAATKLLKSAA